MLSIINIIKRKNIKRRVQLISIPPENITLHHLQGAIWAVISINLLFPTCSLYVFQMEYPPGT